MPSSTKAQLLYQSSKVPCSVLSTGTVYTRRDLSGSDGEFIGTDPKPVEVEITNGRGRDITLDQNGFCLVADEAPAVDFFNDKEVLEKYYTACEELVMKVTGASRVLAFDHNLRAKQRKLAGARLAGGNAVQEPLVGYGVHNDYTATSSVNRVRQLAQPPKSNDTLRASGEGSRIAPAELDSLLSGRWAFFNVWRNVASEPVERFPLAAADARTVAKDDLVVFEIRYADRIGENYFARHKESHKWFYFPRMTRDEVMLLKCWDSRGVDFLGPKDAPSVPATFSLHSAFDDPATRPDAPDRESIEVRTVAFFS